MSATLTWFNSNVGTKTGTAIGNYFDDLVTLFAAVSPGSDFLWEVKGSNTGSTPYYISLGRKDGSPGRIAILSWSSAPAGNNTTILDGAPVNSNVYIAYFPAGTGTTLANLTASSGSITGDDTGVVKVVNLGAVTTIYTTSFVPFYFECEDGIVFGFTNTGSTIYWMGAGDLIVDASDTAYPCVFSFAGTSAANFGSNSQATMVWTTTANTAGPGSTAGIRTNYGAANSLFYHAMMCSGQWAGATPSATDVVSDQAAQEYYFSPVPLLGLTKGQGTVLKFRQFGWGVATVMSFVVLYQNGASGRTVAARQFCVSSGGGATYPWFTNFKL